MSPQQIDALVEDLASRASDFIDMVWSGNDYTGEGSEYPQIDREKLRSIIASQSSPAPVPDEQAGEWQWVPKEPTDEMLVSGMEAAMCIPSTSAVEDCKQADACYRAMLTVSPSRPVAAEKREPHTSEQRARPDRFVPSPDGRSIDDDDFIYDATLKVTGDFADDATRHSYAQWICDRLNAGGTHPSTGGGA